MSRRLAFVVVPLLLLGGFLALRAGLGSSGRGEPARVVGGGALAPGAPSAQEPAQMNSAELAEREASARALAGAQPERAEGDDFDRDRAVWIEGRVAFPVGSPPDDTLAVVAFALPEEGGLRSTMQPPHWQELTTRGARWSRTPVGGDGRFRAPLPEGTTRAQLLLDGRFLYLDEAPTVALPAAEPVALEPALGGCIVLRLTPPPAAEDGAARLAGAELRLFGLPTGSGFFGMGANGGARRETTLTEGTLAELRGLPGEHNYFLGADVGDFAPATLFDLELAPGATLERELAFELGARISGTVVDGGGAPVEGAEVSARLESQFGRMGMMGGGGERSATSDAEGRFELLGVQARRMKLRATKPDSIPAETEELRPRDGEVVRGLRLVLESGARIAGALSYDDGAPAAGALVTLTRAGEGQPTFGGRSSFQRSADDQGQFAVGGLEAGASYDVVAIAGRAPQGGLGATLVEAPADVFEDAPADVAAPGAPSRNGYRARREAVPAGTSGLELVLAAPPGLRGVVLDPDGQPLARYELTASLEESALGRSGRASVTVDDPGGRFLMEDVFAGEWRLSIEADGLVTAEEEPRVLVPHAGDLELRTLRAASVEGLVLDPTGAPVANAQIALTRGQSAPRQRGFMGFGGGRRDAVTDGEGRFYLRDRRPGPVTLRATHEEWAPSAELALELLPGVTHGEQVLQLGLGGTLTGEIYADGAPDAGRTIMIMSMAGGSQRSVTSDDGGRFRAEHLEAGQYTVMAQPRMSMLGEMAERDEDPDPVDFMSSMKMTSADVVEGGETHVVLGGAPKDPVRLFGRVTEGGEPVMRAA